jgi:hypothetical protein
MYAWKRIYDLVTGERHNDDVSSIRDASKAAAAAETPMSYLDNFIVDSIRKDKRNIKDSSNSRDANYSRDVMQ